MTVAFNFTITDNVLIMTPSGTLPNNKEFLFTLHPDISGVIPPSGEMDTLGETYQFWFTSTYCPLFTTLGRVKLMVGPEADSLLDDTIYRMIHKNSLDVIELLNLTNGSSFASDYWGCSWTGAPAKLKRYVECKTAYDIMALIKRSGAGGPGSGGQLKTLGDMTIKYGGAGTSSAANDPNTLKDLYACWNDILRSLNAINVAVKGLYDTSKGFGHPVREPQHNRVVRPVIRNRGVNTPRGPFERGYYWKGYTT